MSKNTSVSLGPHFADFIEAKIAEGRYQSASDVIRAALRLLEQEEAKLEALRAAIAEGDQSGPAEPFDFHDFLTEMRTGRA